MPTYFSYIGKLNSSGFFWNDIPPEAGRAIHPTGSFRKEFLVRSRVYTWNRRLLEQKSRFGRQTTRLGSLGPPLPANPILKRSGRKRKSDAGRTRKSGRSIGKRLTLPGR